MVLDILFPKKCLQCNRRGQYLCLSCISKIRFSKQICIECEKPAVDGMTHSKCQRAWGLKGVNSIWVYGGLIRKAILRLKYNFALEIAKELSDCTSQHLLKREAILFRTCILIPIPLHRKRKNWRGFNQVEEIGKLVCREMNWEFQPDVLIRKLNKRPQTELKGDKRKENVQGVFKLSNRGKGLIFEKSIILFDDVLTTGATIKEAAKVLKRNGANSVWGLTIAR